MTETDTLKRASEAITEHINGLLARREDLDRQIDAAIEAGRRLNGGTQAPPQQEKAAPARKSTTGRRSSKGRGTTAAKLPSPRQAEAAAARRDRLVEWLEAHPGEHKSAEIREALDYSGAGMLGEDLRHLVSEGGAKRSGGLRGPSVRFASARAEGRADGAEPESIEAAVPEPVDDAESEETLARRPPATKRHEPDPVNRKKHSTEAEKRKRAVFSFIRENPGATAKECAAALSLEQGSCRLILRTLVESSALYSTGEPLRYAVHAAAPDSDGARTQQEREIVNALRGTPGLRGVELAEWLSRPPEQLSGVLMALVRRGVLTCESGCYSVVEPEPEPEPEKVAA